MLEPEHEITPQRGRRSDSSAEAARRHATIGLDYRLGLLFLSQTQGLAWRVPTAPRFAEEMRLSSAISMYSV